METKGVDPIPFIDLSGLLERGSERWEGLCQDVRKACESFGVFTVKYNGIPGCVKEEMFEAMKDVFDLPTETKKKNYNPKPYFGYVGGYHVLPLYESLGVEDATEMEVAEAFTRLMWLDGKPEFWYLNDVDYFGGFEHEDLEQLFDAMSSNYKAWVSGFAPLAVGGDMDSGFLP